MEAPLFDFQMKCFRLIGYHRSTDMKTRHALHFIQLIGIGAVLFCDLSHVIFVSENYQNVLLNAECFATLLTSFLVTSKLLSIYFRKKRFFELIARVRGMSSDLLNEKNLFSVKKMDRVISILYFSSCGFVSFGYCARPIFLNLKDYYFYGTFLRVEFPFNCAFFYDASTFPAYHLTYAVLTVSSVVAVLTINGIDSTFFGLSVSICACFDALRSSFDGDKKKFVERHQAILDLVEDLNQLIKQIIFAQFLISSMQLCVIWFQIFMHDNFIQIIIDCIFGFAICLQLFFYAYGGQQIIERSSAVADNFFESDKDFVLIIARAQKTAKINSAFYTATLPAYITILSSSTSLMTLWKSFID